MPSPREDDSGSPAGLPWDRGKILVAAVLFEAGLAPFSLALGWIVGRNPLDGFVLSGRDAAWGVAAALPMLGLFLAGIRWPIGPLARIKRFFDEELIPLLKGRPRSDLALISLAAGFGEETLFRGVIQGALAAAIGRWPALVIASALFGLVHPITPGYILIAGLLGAYLGTVWIATGNLLTAIVAHALYDFLALWIVLRRSDIDVDDSGLDRELRV